MNLAIRHAFAWLNCIDSRKIIVGIFGQSPSRKETKQKKTK